MVRIPEAAKRSAKESQEQLKSYHLMKKATISDSFLIFCEPAGTRTQDPYIKSVMLYQLSYEFNLMNNLRLWFKNFPNPRPDSHRKELPDILTLKKRGYRFW